MEPYTVTLINTLDVTMTLNTQNVYSAVGLHDVSIFNDHLNAVLFSCQYNNNYSH